MQDSPNLPRAVADTLDRTREPVRFSAASVYELAYKHRLGKLPQLDDHIADLLPAAVQARFTLYPLTAAHAFAAATLNTDHRDPFDRMLFAQALSDDLTLISNETIADEVGVRRLW